MSRSIGKEEFVKNKETIQERGPVSSIDLLGEIKSLGSNFLKTFLLREINNIMTEMK